MGRWQERRETAKPNQTVVTLSATNAADVRRQLSSTPERISPFPVSPDPVPNAELPNMHSHSYQESKWVLYNLSDKQWLIECRPGHYYHTPEECPLGDFISIEGSSSTPFTGVCQDGDISSLHHHMEFATCMHCSWADRPFIVYLLRATKLWATKLTL